MSVLLCFSPRRRPSSARARSATLSGVKPNFSSTSSPGAEAPKSSRETTSPSPTQRLQPKLAAASTASRAGTAGGSTWSR